jgi:hypothetical protein
MFNTACPHAPPALRRSLHPEALRERRHAAAGSRATGGVRHLVAAVALLASAPALATNYFVGAGCTYATVQAAINAAAAQVSGSRPVIYVATNQAYSNQALSITTGHQDTVTLHGGVPNCGTTSSGMTTLNGGTSAPVITVTGTIRVTLSHLAISGGHGNNGGGINFAATGTLAIDNSTISDNYANNGAGIRFAPSGDSDLYLNANTFIQSNHAAATGGGIRADTTHARVHIDAAPVWIQGNDAGDNGGGIAMVGGAYAHIGSPGYLFGGVVYGNTANYGGGIALIAESTGSPQVDLFAADPNRPVRIEQNGAYQAGGGIYLVPWFSFPSSVGEAFLQLGGAQIDGNVAQEGSAIYADSVFGARAEVHFYGGHCTAATECNAMSDNKAQGIANHFQPTTGSTLLMQTGSVIEAHELAMRGNQGAHAIRIVDSLGAPLTLDTCLIAGNDVSAELATFGNAAATVDQCTFADNTIGGTSVLYAETGFTMTRSIIEQGSLSTLHYVGSGDGLVLDYLLVSPAAPTLTVGATHIITGDAEFVDPAGSDYHLRHVSPAIDVAPGGAAEDRDLDHRARDQDLPGVPNIDGPRDLGAYERQPGVCDASDTILCDGFELN